MTVLSFIQKTLTPKIAPMVYIMMGVSVIIGFFFMTGLDMGAGESILYGTGVLVHKVTWGSVLFITASIAEIGFFTRREWMIKLGGISGFMVWLFACIALTMAGHWYILLTVGLFHLLFHGYVYLATAIGVIYRRPI